MSSSGGESVGDAEVIRESDSGLALLIRLTDIGETRWIPKAVIHDDSEVYDARDNAAGDLILKTSWAEKEGLI